MHNSQRTICTPNWKEDREYGDVELTVYPNRELVGQILSYGSFLEVMEPVSFRERIVDELRKILERY
jgi:predicted DNA-binding transcriptional regulator YafY